MFSHELYRCASLIKNVVILVFKCIIIQILIVQSVNRTGDKFSLQDIFFLTNISPHDKFPRTFLPPQLKNGGCFKVSNISKIKLRYLTIYVLCNIYHLARIINQLMLSPPPQINLVVMIVYSLRYDYSWDSETIIYNI